MKLALKITISLVIFALIVYALIVIFFGTLPPSDAGRFFGRCATSPEFQCFESQLTRVSDAQMNVRVVLINQLGKTITFDNSPSAINATSMYGSASSGMAANCAFNPLTAQSGAKTELECNLTASNEPFPAVGEKMKMAVDFVYKEEGKPFSQPIHMELLGTLYK